MLKARSNLKRQAPAEAKELTGAGATFPSPVHQVAETYGKESGLRLNYQASARAAAFRRSRKKPWISVLPMNHETKRNSKRKDCSSSPWQWRCSAVVNIEGITDGQIQLTPQVLCGIYLGTIKKWNSRKSRSSTKA
jgi:phosphate transport system substrate-binding protein